jgi:isopentenyldiphosphate isomerase
MEYTEYFDILDENGSPLGFTKLRADAHRDGDWHRTVHIWILNSQNELLIQKRSPNTPSYPNTWDISCAGHIMAGGNAKSTVVKELGEELGVVLGNQQPEYLFSTKQQQVLQNGAFRNNELCDVFLLPLDLKISDFTIQKEELTEIKFVHFSELEKQIVDRDNEFVPHPEEYSKLFSLLHQRYD